MKKLLIIDANSLIYRCFHALPPFTDKEGRPTGALYGLASVLIKIFREQSPSHIVAFFDRPEPTFRKEMYKEYKGQRPPAPDELKSQIIEAHNLFESFSVKTFEIPGFEADDLIGSAVEKFKNEPELKIVVLTGDLDALQLIDNGKIVIETFKKGISDTIIYDSEAVKNRFGVLPKQMPDYKGLVGDSSDNISGVKGIGPKTASPLIAKYGSLENFLEEGQNEKAYKKIFEAQETAKLSKELAIIRRDAPLEIKNLDEIRHQGLQKEKISEYFEKLGFKKMIERINNH